MTPAPGGGAGPAGALGELVAAGDELSAAVPNAVRLGTAKMRDDWARGRLALRIMREFEAAHPNLPPRTLWPNHSP